ncbi:MAG: CcmD family protein [Saprospiraceae bacterium]|jgi:CcmD family protein|nr:CcmD family protein [Saprospiraceae bacterium]MBP9195948.1 CcmD family protein [Saprospiraceae bacterium]
MLRQWVNCILWGSWILLFFPSTAMAQSHDSDFLRSTGKIYSVIAGVVVIFIGISIYLWKIDNKLTNLEKQIKDEHETN